jgi:hypothetical protein
MVSGKRGQYANIELWFLMAAFLLAAVVGVDLLQDTKQVLDGTLLEKNFIARDLAMTLEAIYAAPGNIEYTYLLGTYKYNIDISRDTVTVRDDTDTVSYRMIGIGTTHDSYTSLENPKGYKIEFPDFVTIKLAKNTEGKVCDKPIALTLSKRIDDNGRAKIGVGAKNALVCADGDEGCAGKVIKCE